jgi:hypothetical protein
MDVNSKKSHVIDTMFVICLMFLFVLCAVSVIGIGASIYNKNVGQMADNYSHRITSAYVTEKVRQADENGAVFTKELFGKNVLVLQEQQGNDLYDTYIYEYEGYLMELYIRDSIKTFYPQSGQKILKVNSFNVAENTDSVLEVDIVTEDGNKNRLYIAKRSTRQQ